MEETRLARVLLLLALVCGLTLRLGWIDRHSLWGDEGWTLETVSGSFPEVVERCRRDVHPPLYFLITKLVVSIRLHEATARLPSAVASFLMLWVLCRLGRRHLGQSGWVLFALWICASPYLLQPAREARAYALLGLLSAVWLTLVSSWLDEPELFGPARAVAAAGATAAAIYSHHFGWLLLGAGLVVPPLTLASWALLKTVGRWYLAMVLAAVVSIPALLWVVQVAASTPRLSYSPAQVAKRVLGIWVHLSGGYGLANMTLAELSEEVASLRGLLFLGLTALVMGLTIVGAWLDRPWLDRKGRLLLAAVLVPAAGAAVLNFSHLTARYLIVCAPAFFLLTVRSLERLPRPAFLVAVAAVALNTGLGTVSLITSPTDVIHKEDWRALGAWLSRQTPRPASAVVWVRAGAGTRFLLEFYRVDAPGPADRPPWPPPGRPFQAGPVQTPWGQTGRSRRLFVVLGKSHGGLDLSPEGLAAQTVAIGKLSRLRFVRIHPGFGADLRVLEFGG